jgi:peroxiredoxin
VNRAWADSLGYLYELWSDTDTVLLTHYDALPSTKSLPLRHAYILDADGFARIRHLGAVSVGANPQQVLEDCQTLLEELEDDGS